MKLKLGLVPGFFVKALAVPFMLGAVKYQEGDWATHDEAFVKDRVHSAARHWAAFLDGVVYDEDGQHNLAAAAWNMLVILWYRNRLYEEPLYDKRYPARLDELDRRKQTN